MTKAGKTEKSTTLEVVLSGSLSLSAASEIRQRLLGALDEADTVKLLLRDVDDVDLSLVQIICAAHRSALLKNKTLKLQDNLPELFAQIIEDAGLNGHIGCSAEQKEHCVWKD